MGLRVTHTHREKQRATERTKTIEKCVCGAGISCTKVATLNTNERISFEHVILSNAAFVTNYGSLTLTASDDLFQRKCLADFQIVLFARSFIRPVDVCDTCVRS